MRTAFLASRFFLSAARATAFAATALLAGSPVVGAAEVDFLRDVRPILSGACFKCHGPDESTRKGGLRLDLREEALKAAKSGEIAIAPGKPDESEIIRRILASDEDDLMPPPAAKHPLTEKEKDILRKWVAEGAEYKPHWAFVAPKDQPLPKVENASWPRNGVDHFILARLEKEGLKPSARADKYSLARRLYLDLIGLPPTPEEADEFVNNTSAGAYEQLVDKLLSSSHYGERWARRWLDLARYADTNGYEKDRTRSMWPYRDWVIKALNDGMPFDRFTMEQIAGDMLPDSTESQRIATGFHRNTMINEEGGIDPLEFRFYSMVDRVHVTSTAWLGLTMACAQCHTHKYDPIQHSEYYQFMAFMNNADEPTADVQDKEIAKKRADAQVRIAELEAALPGKFPAAFNVEWLAPAAGEFSAESGAEAEFLPDGSFRVSGANPDKDAHTVTFTASPRRITHLQLEAIPDDAVGTGGPGRRDNGNFVLSEIELELRGPGANGSSRKLKLARAEADYSQNGFPAANAIDGKRDTGWAVGSDSGKRFHRRSIYTLAEPAPLAAGESVIVRLIQQYGGQHTLGRFRVSVGTELESSVPLAERRRENLERKFAAWLKKEMSNVAEWKPLSPSEARSQTPVLTVESDASVYATGDFTKSDTYTLKFKRPPGGIKAIRLEAMTDERLPEGGPGTVHYEGPAGDFWLSNIKVLADGKPVALSGATQSYASGGNNAAKALDDDLQSGWSVDGAQGRGHSAVFTLGEALASADELQIDLLFERYYAAGLGRFRIWVTTEDKARASGLPNDALAALLKGRETGAIESFIQSGGAAKDREILLREFVQTAPELAAERAEIARIRSEMPQFSTTLVMRERAPGTERATHRYHRGEFLQPKETVAPGIPSFLPPLADGAPTNRLGFAQWLVSPENPLTARVIMNRDWEAFFGRGLVRTVEDFGFQGELPSHPELLDWLAREFVKQGWSRKKMHKLVVMSAAYQQSSRITPELEERDPLNILLARGPRLRIEAELVRDLALTASGLISEKIGGPSVFPPQPPGVSTEGAYGALTWKVSSGADRYRRGLYTFAKRTAPYAMTAAFDGPSGEACMARRDRSNTPLQALTLLNDETFLECARALGKWAAEKDGGTDAVAEAVFRRCLTRPPNASERAKLMQFYHEQLGRLERGELKAAEILGESEGARLNERAAWTLVSRVVLNLDETITKS